MDPDYFMILILEENIFLAVALQFIVASVLAQWMMTGKWLNNLCFVYQRKRVTPQC
jgi:hypothetical protein